MTHYNELHFQTNDLIIPQLHFILYQKSISKKKLRAAKLFLTLNNKIIKI